MTEPRNPKGQEVELDYFPKDWILPIECFGNLIGIKAKRCAKCDKIKFTSNDDKVFVCARCRPLVYSNLYIF